MPSSSPVPETVDQYIAGFPADVQRVLKKVRQVVRRAAPTAAETISYRMPAFRQGRILIYFAAFQRHLGLFPPVRGDRVLLQAVARYAGPKGNLKFPLDQPIPYDLIERIVRHRVAVETGGTGGKSPVGRTKKATSARTRRAKSRSDANTALAKRPANRKRRK